MTRQEEDALTIKQPPQNLIQSPPSPPLPTPPSVKGAPIKGSPAPIKGTSILLNEEELEQIEREKTLNIVKLAATDQLNSEIVTNRTRGKETR